jgi:hypothetical protein
MKVELAIIRPVIILALLSMAVAKGQGQQQTLDTSSKPVLRVCLDVAGSKVPGDYDDLISSLRDGAKNKDSSLGATVLPVPLFTEIRERCNYILRLGVRETVHWNEGNYQADQPHSARTDVPFWLFRAGNDKAITHDLAAVMGIESPQIRYSQNKLMMVIAQKTLKAIEKDRRR